MGVVNSNVGVACSKVGVVTTLGCENIVASSVSTLSFFATSQALVSRSGPSLVDSVTMERCVLSLLVGVASCSCDPLRSSSVSSSSSSEESHWSPRRSASSSARGIALIGTDSTLTFEPLLVLPRLDWLSWLPSRFTVCWSLRCVGFGEIVLLGFEWSSVLVTAALLLAKCLSLCRLSADGDLDLSNTGLTSLGGGGGGGGGHVLTNQSKDWYTI